MCSECGPPDFSAYEIPEGTMPLWGIRYAKGVDENGEMGEFFKIDGDVSWMELIGHLELVKAELMKQYLSDEEEE